MAKFFTLLPSIALLSGALMCSTGTAFAQTTTEEQPAPVEALPLGEPADETPQPGETYVKETFGDWAMRCIVIANGDDRCQMYQLLADNADAPIAEFTMFRLPEGNEAAAGATVIVPLETSLGQQLTIKVDDQPAKRYPFAFCNTIGCYARIGLTQEDVDTFKRGGAAVLSIVPIAAQDQRVNVTLSLDGFTASYEASSILEP